MCFYRFFDFKQIRVVAAYRARITSGVSTNKQKYLIFSVIVSLTVVFEKITFAVFPQGNIWKAGKV